MSPMFIETTSREHRVSKMRRSKWIVFVTSLGVVLGLSLLLRVWSFEPLPSRPSSSDRHVRGAVHVHSDRSDGAGSVSEIAAAAHDAGLDFVVMTDHSDLDALGTDEYLNDVLIIKGAEISTRAGHLLTLGIDAPEFRFDGDPEKVLSDVLDLGGFAVVAHPLSRDADQAWTYDGPLSAGGIEVINAATGLQGDRWRTVTGAALALINRRYGLVRALTPLRPALELWDRLPEAVVPIAGADAHGGIGDGHGRFLRVPTYEDIFALFSNHVELEQPLTGKAATDAALVLHGLQSGRGFVALDGLAEASGFSMRRHSSELAVSSPIDACRFVLLRDGIEVARAQGPRWSTGLSEPGIYRVEVFLERASPLHTSIPWIVSNRVYFARLPKMPTSPERTRIPGDGVLVENVVWTTEADLESRVSQPEADGDAITFDFTMGDSEASARRSHCVLATSPPGTMGDGRGLSFSYKADGIYRFDVQLRDRTVDGIEPWRESVKTSSEWRHAYFLFDELHSYAPDSDGRFDPEHAVGLAFYLDTATVRPGVSGRIWIRDLRVHPR